MKLEKVVYDKDLPINIQVCSLDQYPPHYHNDVEIVYVLEGEINFRNGPFDYLLQAGDVFTNNRCEVHSMYSNGDHNKIALIKISGQFFTRYFRNISTSTYMFYSNKENVPEQEQLKNMLLELLAMYLKRGSNYKSKCIDATHNIIEYLNKNFNVFGFTKDQLCKFENTNPVIMKRLHDIIHYTYSNHTSNISLDDLSELTHLNNYYISHLVKDNIGISFTQFLYFVRVEWSEVNLLNPKKKISSIAKSVGFSNTAYYRKYFKHWYNCSPEEYRSRYTPAMKSHHNPEVLIPCDNENAIEVVNKLLAASDTYDSSLRHNKSIVKKVFHVDYNTPTILTMKHDIVPIITLEDHHVLKNRLLSLLEELCCKEVILSCRPKDNVIELTTLRDFLTQQGMSVALSDDEETPQHAFGHDSIASMFRIFNHYMLSDDEKLLVPLRDQMHGSKILSGIPSLLSVSGSKKSPYFAYKLLILMNGDLISSGKNHIVSRCYERQMKYVILTFNYNEAIEQLCLSNNTPYEVKNIIHDFKDELELDITMSFPKGRYFIVNYNFDEFNNYFHTVANMNFSDNLPNTIVDTLDFLSTPNTEVFYQMIDDSIVINNFFSGVGVQLNVLQYIE